MAATPDNAAPDPQQIIAELQRKLDESRAELAARNSAYSERIAYQAAANDVLKVMSASPGDPQPVFDLISVRARDICGAYGVTVCEFDGSLLHWRAATGISEDPAVREANKAAFPAPPTRDLAAGRAILDRATVHIRDHETEPGLRRFSLTVKSSVAVPMMRGGVPIGTLQMGSRERGGFSDIQIELLKTFAEQAAIAITSAETYRELQQRTGDLQESLQFQIAISDVLKVISRSPDDLHPIMDTIVHTARQLCDAEYALILQRSEGGIYQIAAHSNASKELFDWMQHNPVTAGDGSAVGIVASEKQTVHLVDSLNDPRFMDFRRQKMSKARTMLGVPLLQDQDVIGVIFLARTEVKPFRDRQIELVASFADQAVIAVQNAQLFDEVQAKTRDLEEALRYQTGSASILNVIASSPTDVRPVLQAIVESACELCGAYDAMVGLKAGDNLEFSAHHGSIAVSQPTRPIRRDLPAGLAVLDQKPVHIRDLLSSEGDQFPEAQDRARRFGVRTILNIPLLREGESIGAIMIRRQEVNPFQEKQIELLQTFANQAVIAIENARLFNETKEALERQTATAEILKVIASSPSDLQPVFEAIAERSNRLVDALSTTVFTLAGGMMHLRAFTPTTPEADATLQATFPAPVSKFSWGESIGRGEIYRIIDSEHEPESLRAVARLRGWRSCLCVPLLHDGKLIGMIGPTRAEPGPFTDHHVQLLQTFADQAVIAISNVGLFNEVQDRTRELSKSLDDLRAAQDRLVQTEKLASLGQLTAGIAHEIKNPLNFVNNFSALSVELTDELKDVLKQAELTEQIQQDVGQLTQTLKGNLEKVVLHGKRADSIVKNMLLHSRSGSGEHGPAAINTLVDESLNLAYHGARAEKAGFTIALQRDLDPSVGMAEVYPQEITRVLLNIISNGFYAATKRKLDAGDGFEPMLSAATKNLGDKVEIRIRDNGIGIPEEVKEKIFNPFFTTKPSGEGTGLGLSMSHDIIVKQHGGSIDVDSEPGLFTEFKIVLPRTSQR